MHELIRLNNYLSYMLKITQFIKKFIGISKYYKKKNVRYKHELNILSNINNIDNELDTAEKNIIKNLLSFRELKVSEVMIPRTDTIAIPRESSFEEIKELFIKNGYTRMPVYGRDLDDVVGFIHIKDFTPYIDGTKSFDLSKVMRKIIYAPRSTKCLHLLSEMRNTRTHVAVILDEYGGTEGMVVIENLIEKIVGDIRDEHDKDSKIFITKIGEEKYIVDARASIQDVEEILNFSLSQEDGEYETFGGFILSYLDRIPNKGEKFLHPMGLEVEITDADPRKIKSTKIVLLDKESLLNS